MITNILRVQHRQSGCATARLLVSADLDVRSLPQAYRIVDIGMDATFLRVYLYETQFGPYPRNEIVQTSPMVSRNNATCIALALL